jgi:adenylate cyclase
VLQASEELTLIMRPQKTAEPRRLRLEIAGQVRFLAAPIRRISIGRSAQADIVVNDPRASRVHLVLEQRGEQFVLLDQSSNGSFVTQGAMPALRLMRQEFVLEGAGEIGFGPAGEEPDAVRIAYRVERVS